MSDEKLASLMGDARLINASDNIIFPLIKKLIEERITQACGRFQMGETSFIGDISYIYGLRQIEEKLKKLQTQGNEAYKKLHAE
jgi:hypothetical protein